MQNKKQLPSSHSFNGSSIRSMGKKTLGLCTALIALFVLCFVLFPFLLDRIGTANLHTAALSLELTEASPSPAPTAAATASPSISPLPEKPVSDQQVQVSEYSMLQLNDEYPEVETLQLRLMELGYLDSDEPGTVYNDATMAAVSMFQRTMESEINGIADSNLQAHLFSNEATYYEVRLGDNGSDVRSVQKLLHELGYYEGKINGYFGVATEDALEAFQKKNGLEQDGVFNLDDRDLIYSDDAKPFIDPTPTPTPKPTPKPTKKPTTTKKPSATAKPSDKDKDETPKATEKPEKEYPTGGSFNASGNVAGVISVAEAQIGKRYVRGEEGPNTFDCSGLVYYCLSQNGVSLGRRSASSYSENDSWTKISSMSDLQKGDLLFFRDDDSSRVSHTGIYIGGGKMIDASSSKGEVVRRSCTTSYWTRNFVCARRVF